MAGMSSRVRVLAFLGVAALLVLAGVLLPLGQWSESLVTSVRSAGALGALVYAGVYVLATVLWIPGSLLTIGAGFLYGLLGGTLLVLPAATCGAALAFIVGRFAARDWVRAKGRDRPRMAAVYAAIGERGFSIVMLLRLSPLFPFVFLNYALSLTELRLRDYVLASALGMIPGTFLFVYLGTLVTDAAALASGQRPDGGGAQQALFWGGLVATAAVTWWVSRLARQRLERTLAEQSNHA